MSTLLTLSFWFNLRPGSMGSLFRNIFIVLLIVLTLAAIYFFMAKKKKGLYRNFFSKIYNFCISNVIVGLLLLFFNYEIVPFFSAYFWYLIWFISATWWFITIILSLKKIAARKKELAKKDEITKYLP